MGVCTTIVVSYKCSKTGLCRMNWKAVSCDRIDFRKYIDIAFMSLGVNTSASLLGRFNSSSCSLDTIYI